MKVIIVGAGLFGSIAAALACKAGHTVTVIDNQELLAASPCSGNLFKPSWLESIGKEKAAIAYSTLAQLYTLQKINCTVRPLLNKTVALDWIDPAQVLRLPDVVGKVIEVGDGYVRGEGGTKMTGRVLLAAGVWCGEYVTMPRIRRLIGSSMRLKGQVTPSIYLYAPYKHAVAYNLNAKEVWCGDGAAILEANWEATVRIAKLQERAKKFFKLDTSKAVVRVGARPYVEGFKQGYFAQVYPKTWVSTGGAKNGAVLAAYQAHQFVEAIS